MRDKAANIRRRKAFGEIVFAESPLFAGLFFFFTWLSLIVLNIWEHTEYGEPWLKGSVPIITATIFSCITFLLAGFLRDRITLVLRHKTSHFVIMILGSLGSLLWLLLVKGRTTSLLAMILGALLIGVFIGLEGSLWGESSRRREIPRLSMIVAICIPISISVGAVLVSDYFEVLGAPLSSITCILAPIISGICCYKSQHNNESILKPQEFTALEDGSRVAKEGYRWFESTGVLSVSKARFAGKLGTSAFCFGLAAGILAAQAFSVSGLKISGVDLVLTLIANSIVIYVIGRVRPSDGQISFSRCLILFLAISLLCLCKIDGGHPLTASYITLVLTMLFVYPSELSQQYRISPLITHGFFFFFCLISYTVAYILCNACFSTLPPFAKVFAASTLLITGSFTLLNDKKMRSVIVENEADSHDIAKERDKFNGNNLSENKRYFLLRCQKVADRYFLSKRETEILILLAKGRNAGFIQSALTISEGTTRSHMRNIYRKLDVHSQQELMSLVEDIDI